MEPSNPHFGNTNPTQTLDYFSNNVHFILTNDVNTSLATDPLSNVAIDQNGLTYLSQVPLQLVADSNPAGGTLLLEAPPSVSLQQSLTLDSYQIEVLPSGHFVLTSRAVESQESSQQIQTITAVTTGDVSTRAQPKYIATQQVVNQATTQPTIPTICDSKQIENTKSTQIQCKNPRNTQLIKQKTARHFECKKSVPRNYDALHSGHNQNDLTDRNKNQKQLKSSDLDKPKKLEKSNSRGKTAIRDHSKSNKLVNEVDQTKENKKQISESTFKAASDDLNPLEAHQKQAVLDAVKKVSDKNDSGKSDASLYNMQGVLSLQEAIERATRDNRTLNESSRRLNDAQTDSNEPKVQLPDELRLALSIEPRVYAADDPSAQLSSRSVCELLSEARPSGQIQGEPSSADESATVDRTTQSSSSKVEFSNRTLLSKKFRILSGENRSRISREPPVHVPNDSVVQLSNDSVVQLSNDSVVQLSNDSVVQFSDEPRVELSNESKIENLNDPANQLSTESTVYVSTKETHQSNDCEIKAENNISEPTKLEEIWKIVQYDFGRPSGSSQTRSARKSRIKSENLPQLDEDLILPPSKDKYRYKCERCPRAFRLSYQLKRHVYHHLSRDKKLKCSVCEDTFNHKVNHLIHEHLHSLDRLTSLQSADRHSCPVCGITFSRLAGLKSHLLTHLQDDDVMCGQCNAEFSTEYSLELHCLEHHEACESPAAASVGTGGPPNAEPPAKIEPGTPSCEAARRSEQRRARRLTCKVCKTVLSCEEELAKHANYHKKVKYLISGRKYRKGLALKSRSRGKHCHVCNKCFSRPSQLIRHLRIHTGERPFKCEHCAKSFNQKNALDTHMLKHTGARPHQCHICHAAFSQPGNLKIHLQRLHTVPWSEGQELFACPHCPCIFSKQRFYTAHVARRHCSPRESVLRSPKENNSDSSNTQVIDAPRPARSPSCTLSCNICDKPFKKRSDLIRHVRSHTKEKPFNCTGCDKSFSTRQNLKTHHNSMHARTKVYTCNLCSEPRHFNYFSTLRQHQRTIHENVPILCKLCNLQCATFFQLRKHMSIHHPKIIPDSAPAPNSSASLCGSYNTTAHTPTCANFNTNTSNACLNTANTSNACLNSGNTCLNATNTSNICLNTANTSNTCLNTTNINVNTPNTSNICLNTPNTSNSCLNTTNINVNTPNTSNTCLNTPNTSNTCLNTPKTSNTCLNTPNTSNSCLNTTNINVNTPNTSNTCLNTPNTTYTNFTTHASCTNASNARFIANANLSSGGYIATNTNLIANTNYVTNSTNDLTNLLVNQNPSYVAINTNYTATRDGFMATGGVTNANYIAVNTATRNYATVGSSLNYASSVGSFDVASANYLNQILAAINGDGMLVNEDVLALGGLGGTDGENIILVVQPDEYADAGNSAGPQTTTAENSGHFLISSELLDTQYGQTIGEPNSAFGEMVWKHQESSALPKMPEATDSKHLEISDAPPPLVPIQPPLSARTPTDPPERSSVIHKTKRRKVGRLVPRETIASRTQGESENSPKTGPESPEVILESNLGKVDETTTRVNTSAEQESVEAKVDLINSEMIELNVAQAGAELNVQASDGHDKIFLRNERGDIIGVFHHQSALREVLDNLLDSEQPGASDSLVMKFSTSQDGSSSLLPCKVSDMSAETRDILESVKLSKSLSKISDTVLTVKVPAGVSHDAGAVLTPTSQVIRTVLNDGTIVTPAHPVVATAANPFSGQDTQLFSLGQSKTIGQTTVKQSCGLVTTQSSRTNVTTSSQPLSSQSIITSRLVPTNPTSSTSGVRNLPESPSIAATVEIAQDENPVNRDVEMADPAGQNSFHAAQYYGCPFSSCDRILSSEFDLKTHYLAHGTTTVVYYKCKSCDQYLDSEQEAKLHALSHEKYACATCTRVFSNEAQRKIHFMREHCDEFDKMTKEESSAAPAVVQTSESGNTEKSVTALDTSCLLSCVTCGAQFSSPPLLEQHIRASHTQREPPRAKRKPVDRKAKAENVRQLSGEEVTQLLARGAQPRSLSEKVLLDVTKEKLNPPLPPASIVPHAPAAPRPAHPNQCALCPKSFKKPIDLTRHRRVHTKEKPYACATCGARFSLKSSLVAHGNTHSRMRRFPCHVCGRDFACASSLKVHMRLHAGSRPFICPVVDCGKTFTNSGHCNSHLLTHDKHELPEELRLNVHPESDPRKKLLKRGVCPVCKKAVSDFSRHLHCKGCSKLFLSEGALQTHRDRVHGLAASPRDRRKHIKQEMLEESTLAAALKLPSKKIIPRPVASVPSSELIRDQNAHTPSSVQISGQMFNLVASGRGGMNSNDFLTDLDLQASLEKW